MKDIYTTNNNRDGENLEDIPQTPYASNHTRSDRNPYQHIVVDHQYVTDLLNELSHRFYTSTQHVMQQTQQVDLLSKTIEKQQSIIQKQQDAIQRFQSDQTFKIKKPLLMGLIELADNLRILYQDYSEKEGTDFNEVVNEFKNLESWVDSLLEDHDVRKFNATLESDEYDRTRQDIVDRKLVEDEALDGHVVSDQPGYTWTAPYLIIESETQLAKEEKENNIPKKYTYVLRPEQVIKCVVKKKD